MIPMVPKSEPKIVQGLQNDPIGRPKWTKNHKKLLKIIYGYENISEIEVKSEVIAHE